MSRARVPHKSRAVPPALPVGLGLPRAHAAQGRATGRHPLAHLRQVFETPASLHERQLAVYRAQRYLA